MTWAVITMTYSLFTMKTGAFKFSIIARRKKMIQWNWAILLLLKRNTFYSECKRFQIVYSRPRLSCFYWTCQIWRWSHRIRRFYSWSQLKILTRLAPRLSLQLTVYNFIDLTKKIHFHRGFYFKFLENFNSNGVSKYIYLCL